MTERPQTTGGDRSQDTTVDGFRRREFVALGAGASATLLAGCAGDGALPTSGGSDGSDGSGDSDGDSNALTGGFRLLISDAPADIADFDSLDVTLSEARVYSAGDGEDDGDAEEADDDESDGDDDESDDGTDQSGNKTDTESDSPNGTATGDEADEADAAEEEDDEADDDERGFTVVDLDGATVDLTQVIDEDATAVFDGEIPAGEYEKVELSVSAVEGIVDGESVDVKLPSEKLQITNGFEVTPDEPVSFVFDINVVKRGKNNGYILKPVISGSGVAGRDVEVNEIDDEDEADDESEADDEETGEADDEDDEKAGETDDGTENETDADGTNQTDTDGAQNETATESGD